jgi:hypothetical protein
MPTNPYQPPGTEPIDGTRARNEILARWLAAECGTGIEHARRVRYYMAFGAFAIFAAVFGISRFFEMPTLVTVILAIPVGWLIAEANALQYRIDHWPIFREYIDWAKVKRDHPDQVEASGN